MLIVRPKWGNDMKIHLHQGDLPDGLDLGTLVAIDTETLGLNPHRDRLCLAQLSAGDGVCHAVQFAAGQYAAPNLKQLLADPAVTKLFHFARFDIAMFRRYLGVDCKPIYCTKIASKLVRTYTDQHGLKDLVRELLNVDLSQGAAKLGLGRRRTERKAARLCRQRRRLSASARRRCWTPCWRAKAAPHLAKACFDFLPTRAELDLAGWEEIDIFAH